MEQLLVPFTLTDGKWKSQKSLNVNVSKKSLRAVRELIYDRQMHSKLYDFDNHLDDLKCNWLNTHLHAIIDECAANAEES
jgi:hypothetical protein